MSARVPELEPMLALKSGRFYYLCTYRNVWDPQKGRSYRESTTSVGKILSGRKDGPVEWKDIYLEHHPELADFSCSRGEDGTLSFTPLTGQTGSVTSCHLALGATWTLEKIIEGSALEEALHVTFGKYSDWRKLLSLAYFLVISNENIMSRFPSFSKHSYLPWMRVMTPDDVRRLLSRITQEKIALFKSRLLSSRDPKAQYLVFASSSIYKRHTSFSWSARAEISDDESRSPENCIMAVEEQSGIPLCYHLSHGRRVPDVAVLRVLINNLTRMDFSGRVLYVADRGYAGATQISRYLAENMNFLVNPRVHHGIFRPLMETARRKLFDLSNYHPSIGCAAITRRVHWSYHEFLEGHRVRRSASLYLHIYFDEGVYNQNREGIKRGIGMVYEAVSRGEQLSDDLQEVRTLYMRDSLKNGMLEVNEEAVKLTLDKRSVRLLLTDCVADPVEAFRDYFDRNEVWAGFKTYRERLGGSRLVSGDETCLEGKAFVQFLASSLAVMLRRRLCKAGQAMAGLPYNSDDVILGMLSGIELNYSPRMGAVVGEPSRRLGQLLASIDIQLPKKDLPDPHQEVDAAALAEQRDYADLKDPAEHNQRLSREELIYRQLA